MKKKLVKKPAPAKQSASTWSVDCKVASTRCDDRERWENYYRLAMAMIVENIGRDAVRKNAFPLYPPAYISVNARDIANSMLEISQECWPEAKP